MLIQHFIPELKLHSEVYDDQNLGVEQDEEPEKTSGTLLLQHAVSKNRDRVNHVKQTSLHKSCQEHHHVAEQLTVTNDNLVEDDKVAGHARLPGQELLHVDDLPIFETFLEDFRLP